MQSNPYAYVVSHLNLAISRKKLRIRVKHSRKTLELIKVLFAIGYVSNYTIVNSGPTFRKKIKTKKLPYIHLSLMFYKNTAFFKSLRLVSTPSKKHTTSLKALKIMNTSMKSSIAIVSTSYGIIDHKEALRLNTGGVILCIAS